MKFVYLSECLGYSFSPFVFKKPQKGPEKKSEAPEKSGKKPDVPEGNEKALADMKKLIAAFKQKGVPIEKIPDLIAKEAPKLQQQVASNEKLTSAQKKMLDSLIDQYIEHKKQEVQSYLAEVQQKISSRATEVKHQALDYATKGAKYGATGAIAMTPGVNLIAGVGYGLYKGYQAIKESGRDEARAEFAQKEKVSRSDLKKTLAVVAKMPGKEGADATKQLEMFKAVEENEAKLLKASKIADEYSEAKFLGKENINSYTGSDLKGEYYDADQVRESAAGAIAAAYMLEGEAGAKRMRDSINEKEKKGWSESDAVQIGDVQWSVNDYPGGAGAGAGMGDKLESYQKSYKRVNSASRTFATMYVSKAFKSKGFEDSKAFESYKKYVEGKLKDTNVALGKEGVRGDEAHAAFMAGLLTPDQFLKIQGGASEEKETSKEEKKKIAQRRKELKGLRLAHDSFQKSLKGKFKNGMGALDIEGIPDEEVTDELVTKFRADLAHNMAAAYQKSFGAFNARTGSTTALLVNMTSDTASRMAPSYHKIAKKLSVTFAEKPILGVVTPPDGGSAESMAAAAMKMRKADDAHDAWLKANKADLATLQKWHGKNQQTVEKWEEKSTDAATKKRSGSPQQKKTPSKKPKKTVDAKDLLISTKIQADRKKKKPDGYNKKPIDKAPEWVAQWAEKNKAEKPGYIELRRGKERVVAHVKKSKDGGKVTVEYYPVEEKVKKSA